MFLKVICAWCSKYMDSKGARFYGKSPHFVSHGICPDCAKKLLEQLKDEIGT